MGTNGMSGRRGARLKDEGGKMKDEGARVQSGEERRSVRARSVTVKRISPQRHSAA